MSISKTKRARPAKNEKLRELIGKLLSELEARPKKLAILSKLAIESLERNYRYYQKDGHSFSFAVVDTVREVLFDNSTSSDWSRSPFSSVKTYMESQDCQCSQWHIELEKGPCFLSKEILTLLRFLFYYKCRPEECDHLFSLRKGSSAEVLQQVLQGLHRGSVKEHNDECSTSSLENLVFRRIPDTKSCRLCTSLTMKIEELRRNLDELGEANVRDRSEATARDRSEATALDRSEATALDRSEATARDRSEATALNRSEATVIPAQSIEPPVKPVKPMKPMKPMKQQSRGTRIIALRGKMTKSGAGGSSTKVNLLLLSFLILVLIVAPTTVVSSLSHSAPSKERRMKGPNEQPSQRLSKAYEKELSSSYSQTCSDLNPRRKKGKRSIAPSEGVQDQGAFYEHLF